MFQSISRQAIARRAAPLTMRRLTPQVIPLHRQTSRFYSDTTDNNNTSREATPQMPPNLWDHADIIRRQIRERHVKTTTESDAEKLMGEASVALGLIRRVLAEQQESLLATPSSPPSGKRVAAAEKELDRLRIILEFMALGFCHRRDTAEWGAMTETEVDLFGVLQGSEGKESEVMEGLNKLWAEFQEGEDLEEKQAQTNARIEGFSFGFLALAIPLLFFMFGTLLHASGTDESSNDTRAKGKPEPKQKYLYVPGLRGGRMEVYEHISDVHVRPIVYW
ncbi:hypothetical protein QBC40DRAFT_276198 [Triangularia verruculosa]|uniref:Uncharacterized protein n=1 Tax=Triangularia verruculosa TaxID=2587418 RepID=A0AAN7AZ65_9PEZI|nr:hypothetical protein QBC40DRAFT_276198 [Triangularia verruculosa]